MNVVDTQQIPIAPIVEIDVENLRVRVRCPYHKGIRGHTHWVSLLRQGICSVTATDEYLVRAGCRVDKRFRIDLKGSEE